LTRRRVTTSFVFASIHVLISAKNDSSVPASRSVQVVWQSSNVPFWLCTCACNNRIPAERATVAL
jgi:hypothetical protein